MSITAKSKYVSTTAKSKYVSITVKSKYVSITVKSKDLTVLLDYPGHTVFLLHIQDHLFKSNVTKCMNNESFDLGAIQNSMQKLTI